MSNLGQPRCPSTAATAAAAAAIPAATAANAATVVALAVAIGDAKVCGAVHRAHRAACRVFSSQHLAVYAVKKARCNVQFAVDGKEQRQARGAQGVDIFFAAHGAPTAAQT